MDENGAHKNHKPHVFPNGVSPIRNGFVTFRSNILSLFEEKCEKWNLEEITYGSYVANYGFRNKFCAADVAYACLAVMEQHLETAGGGGGVDASAEGGGGGGGGDGSVSARRRLANAEKSFYEASDALSRANIAVLEKGIEKGRDLLTLVMKQVHMPSNYTKQPLLFRSPDLPRQISAIFH